jgi:hypothetical protein
MVLAVETMCDPECPTATLAPSALPTPKSASTNMVQLGPETGCQLMIDIVPQIYQICGEPKYDVTQIQFRIKMI